MHSFSVIAQIICLRHPVHSQRTILLIRQRPQTFVGRQSVASTELREAFGRRRGWDVWRVAPPRCSSGKTSRQSRPTMSPAAEAETEEEAEERQRNYEQQRKEYEQEPFIRRGYRWTPLTGSF